MRSQEAVDDAQAVQVDSATLAPAMEKLVEARRVQRLLSASLLRMLQATGDLPELSAAEDESPEAIDAAAKKLIRRSNRSMRHANKVMLDLFAAKSGATVAAGGGMPGLSLAESTEYQSAAKVDTEELQEAIEEARDRRVPGNAIKAAEQLLQEAKEMQAGMTHGATGFAMRLRRKAQQRRKTNAATRRLAEASADRKAAFEQMRLTRTNTILLRGATDELKASLKVWSPLRTYWRAAGSCCVLRLRRMPRRRGQPLPDAHRGGRLRASNSSKRSASRTRRTRWRRRSSSSRLASSRGSSSTRRPRRGSSSSRR